IDAGKTGAQASLKDNGSLSFIDIQDRHTINRTALLRLSSRIYHIIGPNDKHNVSGFKFRIDLFHIKKLIVWHVCFGQQHIHMAGHAARDRMDAVLYFHPSLPHLINYFLKYMMRLSNGQLIAGGNHDLISISTLYGYSLSRRFATRFIGIGGRTSSSAASAIAHTSTEKYLRKGSIHRFAHSIGQNE